MTLGHARRMVKERCIRLPHGWAVRVRAVSDTTWAIIGLVETVSVAAVVAATSYLFYRRALILIERQQAAFLNALGLFVAGSVEETGPELR